MNKRVIIVLLLGIFIIGMSFISTKTDQVDEFNAQVESVEDFYKVTVNRDDSYTINFFNKNGDILRCDTTLIEPYISIIDDNIISVEIWYGSPAYYTYFYNTTNYKFSPKYNNISLAKNGKVVYMLDGKTLIVSDIFDKDTFYKEIVRDFSPVAVYSNAIISAKFINDNKLCIEYLEGHAYTIQTTAIELY